MGVFEKLAKVQSELKAPKDQYNSFGKYKYRSCEDILEAAKPLCIANGLILTVSDSLKNIGDRYYIEATAQVVDIESSEKHFVTAFAREEESKKGMDGAQITGTSSSYSRKYALNGLFCIDDTKDADTDEHKHQMNKAPERAPEKAPPREKSAKDLEVEKAKVLEDLRVSMVKAKLSEKQIILTYKKDANKVVAKLEDIPVKQLVAYQILADVVAKEKAKEVEEKAKA